MKMRWTQCLGRKAGVPPLPLHPTATFFFLLITIKVIYVYLGKYRQAKMRKIKIISNLTNQNNCG